ncbi:MAG TPA: DUF1622 domain-containing protein [Caulobacteraceae bacterium]
MNIVLKHVAELVADGLDLTTVLVVAVGAGEVFIRALRSIRRLATTELKVRIRVGFASWILLALEFALAADIARTAIDVERLGGSMAPGPA